MKKQFYILFSFLLITVAAFAQTDEIKAFASLDSNKIKVGEQTTLDLIIAVPVKDNITFPPLKDSLKGGVEILDVSEIDTSYEDGDLSVRYLSQKLTITAWDSGFYAIEPFEFKVGNQIVKTNALLLEVITVEIDAKADIKDIKGIEDVPFSLKEFLKLYWYWFAIPLLLILIGIAIFYFIQSRPEKEVKIKTVIPDVPAHEWALEQLELLDSKKVWQNNHVKEYYSDLTFILRAYIEKRFNTPALEQTSDEIITSLRYDTMDEEARRKLMKVLMIADMVKFAKEIPMASENESAIVDVRGFVNTTKQIEVKEEVKEEVES